MAFRFRNKNNVTASAQRPTNGSSEEANRVVPKLTSAQMIQLAKLYPPWLKDNTALKQLPGVYQGVLGQVQLQPGIEEIEKKLIGKQENPTDYMSRFSDTERVHQLLSASRLPNETLATIWAHVNKTFPGKLTNREVCLALALIAIFQQLDKEASVGRNHFSPSGRDKDPFNLVRNQKKPPVPTLYSAATKNNNNNNSDNGGFIKGVVQSKSTPENLGSIKDLLVDIPSSNGDGTPRNSLNDGSKRQALSDCSLTESDLNSEIKNILLNDPISLIDMDFGKFEIDFNKTTKVWFKFLLSMRNIFKRSFDVLNVENSRQSALEALKSSRGIEFGRNISICYPLAHNIKYKFDQLNSIHLTINEQSNTRTNIRGLFHKGYALRVDDLMTSINEYWAVLINLLHESGQTEFIELIMDGLLQHKTSDKSASIDDIAKEFSARPDICSICHSRFYLDPAYDFSLKQLPREVLQLLEPEDLVNTDDQQHYYHPRCASFWLNQIDTTGLPFLSDCINQTILSPALID